MKWKKKSRKAEGVWRNIGEDFPVDNLQFYPITSASLDHQSFPLNRQFHKQLHQQLIIASSKACHFILATPFLSSLHNFLQAASP